MLHRMLEALGLSQRAQVFLVANLPRIKQGPQEAQEVLEHAQALGLTTPGDTTRGSYLLVEDMEEEEALAVLQDLFHDSFSGPMGNRSTEEILSRFIQKLRRGDDPERVDRGISILSRMASLKGEARPILSQVRSVVGEYGLDPKVLGPLEEVVSGFQKRKTEVSLTLDMGLVRDIAYYTGMVFEVLASGPDGGTLALCGGGRYDGLVKALGGTEDVPALGFAYTVETLLELMPERLEGGHLTSSYSQRR